jgi:hypothetical protein
MELDPREAPEGSRMTAGLFSSRSDDWSTPPNVFERERKVQAVLQQGSIRWTRTRMRSLKDDKISRCTTIGVRQLPARD